MSTYLVKFNGESKPVKNLGWLLRHWKEVDFICITKLRDGRGWMRVFLKRPKRDGVFYYFATWESWELCVQWVHRPVLRGVPVVIQRFDYEKLEHTVETITTA